MAGVEKNNSEDIENLMLPTKYPNIVLTTKRKCTNIISLCIFIIFFIGWIIVGYQAFITNNFKRVIYPSDSAGRICGMKHEGIYDLTEKPYLLFFDLTKCVSWTSFMSGCPTKQVCVKECPNKYFTYLQLRSIFSDATFYKKLKEEIICTNDNIKYNIKSFEDLRRYVKFGECIAYTVKSSSLLGRCIPTIVTNLISSTKKNNLSLNEIVKVTGNDNNIPNDEDFSKNISKIYTNIIYNKGIIGRILEDIYSAKWKILIFLFCAAVISLIYVNALRILGGMIIWGTISIIFIGLLLGVAFCWHQYKILIDEEEIFNENHFNVNMRSYFDMPDTWKYVGFIISSIFFIFCILILIVRNRIKIALLIIKETNKAICKMPNLLLFPFIPFFLNILCFIFFGTLALWISTSGKENCYRFTTTNISQTLFFNFNQKCDCSSVGTSIDKNCHFYNITKNENIVRSMQFYNIFAYFWSTCFISGFHNTVIAGAIGSYYWTYNKKKDIPKNGVLSSIERTIKYHLGSIALGSLIIAIVKFIRVILEWFYNKFKGSQNRIIQKIYWLLSCWFWILEKILVFLTNYSYIIIAVHGKPFWTSAKHSISLISQNVIRVLVVNRVSSILLFIGKLFITLFFTFMSYRFFSNTMFDEGTFDNYYNNYLTPVVVVTIGTYYIADLFFDVYEFGIATTFVCFLDDCERNDGSVEKPYYMNRSKKAGNIDKIFDEKSVKTEKTKNTKKTKGK